MSVEEDKTKKKERKGKKASGSLWMTLLVNVAKETPFPPPPPHTQ